MNRNVKATYGFYFSMSLANGIVNTVASNFLFELTGQNLYVGMAGAVQGVVQMVMAFPAGYWADKHRSSRSRLLKYAGVIAYVAALVTIIALVVPGSWLARMAALLSVSQEFTRYLILVLAYLLWGLQIGCSEPVQEALFADSMTDGTERTEKESVRSLLDYLGGASGPLTSLVLFVALGDDWSRYHMLLVWLVGACMSVIGSTCLCVYRDSITDNGGIIEVRSRSSTRTRTRTVINAIDHPIEEDDACNDDDVDKTKKTMENDIARIHVKNDEGRQALLLPLSSSSIITIREQEAPLSSSSSPSFGSKRWWIPHLCVACDIGFALGSGMTIRFWPLFFQNAVGTSPVVLNVMLLVASLMTAGATCIAQQMAAHYGRMRVTIVWCILGVTMLFVMGAVRPQWEQQWLMCILYIVRTLLMNATSPLLRAVLMDNIAADHRGKWASVSSISSVGWSGSAVLGGWLCDTHGYGVTFFITAILQALALLPLLPIYWVERSNTSIRRK